MNEVLQPTSQVSGPIRAGWICLGLGLVLILIPFPFFYLYLPLCSVALILAIVGLAKGQAGKGVVLLICSIILPPIFWFIGIGILGSSLQ